MEDTQTFWSERLESVRNEKQSTQTEIDLISIRLKQKQNEERKTSNQISQLQTIHKHLKQDIEHITRTLNYLNTKKDD